ncbi:MAG TPA: rod shape-determining protein MreC [Bacteroidales bacterium]|nr:MAG: rod shape-determining protein MreC [Bacteroidetes bacterium GWE2_42_24]OFY27754.1 MAG: rod shape-determining protein MreC [Bacteroidetes bacterium GWF2_43_11]HAQ64922.1 rod shape-determining protein MreC [Bacteroidales bacterium]HBZ66112.1 rod shape-determining protein MreC [Bacteroidales bacterium]
MRNFLNFVIKYHFALLFGVLEFVSLGLSVQYNAHPEAAFFSRATAISGRVESAWNSITGYFNLIEVNQKLADQNARFLVKQNFSFLHRDTSEIVVSDSSLLQRYTYTPARVISNSVNRRNNFLMIAKGSLDGIEKDMGVIGPDGVVGIVVTVSPHFSSVMSLLHEASLVSAKHQPTNQLGSVVWEGTNYRRISLLNLPVHVPLRVGDSVVTSGFSIIFPEGIPIGRIRKFKPDQGDYYSISLDLFTDFNALGWVYVVKNLYREEQQALIEEQGKAVQPAVNR